MSRNVNSLAPRLHAWAQLALDGVKPRNAVGAKALHIFRKVLFMRLSFLGLAAIGLMSLLFPGCQIEDTNGDGVISVEEVQASLQNFFCGDGEDSSTDTDDTGTGDTGTPQME